ncbi:MAG: DUF6458 family protein [Ferrimicrobium sp.]
MNKQTGTGVIVLGILIVAVGAIMKYAVTATVAGFSIQTVGFILLIVGIVAVLLGLLILTTGTRRHSVTTENINSTPTGSSHTVEREDHLP